MRTAGRALIAIILAGTPGSAVAQVTGSAVARDTAVQDRIHRVENGLLTPVIARGASAGMSLADRMRHYNVPGVSIAVINDGRIEWARGYGLLAAGGTTPVDTATLFQAASISKPVAAIGALRLVEDGTLDLDTDVNSSLASWQVEKNGHTRNQYVTLRRLLSHNAGLTVHGFRGYARGEAIPELVQVLNGERPARSARVRPDTVPGTLWRYSGGGSSVAQLLMQDVTGRDFPALMRELVLAPAGMVHSGYEQPLPPERAANAAVGHRSDGNAVPGGWHTYPEMFAAGLWTTPSDLARLAIHVQQWFNGRTDGILSPAMTREMLRRQAGAFGLGFSLEYGDGWLAFSHGGANEGYRAMLYAFADRGQGVAIMTSGDAGAQLAGEIIRAVAEEYDWPARQAIVRDIVPIAAAELAAFAGYYTGRMDDRTVSVRISIEDGTLRSAGIPIGTRTLHHAGHDVFFHMDAPAEVRFQRDAQGRVAGLLYVAPGGQQLRLTR
jgi:CubicO group peptidase (beta-lactamase class C family)